MPESTEACARRPTCAPTRRRSRRRSGARISAPARSCGCCSVAVAAARCSSPSRRHPAGSLLEELQALGCVVLTSPDAHEVAVAAMGALSARASNSGRQNVDRFCAGRERASRGCSGTSASRRRGSRAACSRSDAVVLRGRLGRATPAAALGRARTAAHPGAARTAPRDESARGERPCGCPLERGLGLIGD